MENNKLDNFYKENLSAYETGVSGSFWLRLKWRLLWLNSKMAIFGIGAAVLIGTGVLAGLFYLNHEPDISNVEPLYTQRSPEMLASLVVLNESNNKEIEHLPISVEAIFDETIKNPEPGTTYTSASTEQAVSEDILLKETMDLMTSPDPYFNKFQKLPELFQLEPKDGVIENIIEIEYDTVLSPYFKKQKKYWFSLSLYAAPAFTSSKIISEQLGDEYLEYRNDHEEASLTWSAGLDLQYNRKNWYVQTGLAYSVYSTNRNYDYSFSAFDENKSYYENDTSWGHVYDPPNIGELVVVGVDSVFVPYYNEINNGTNEWKYIEVPLVFGYKFNRHRFSIDIGTGFSYGYLITVSGNVPSLTEDNNFTDFSEMKNSINRNQFNYILQLGLSYFITPKWSIFAQPYYKQNIQSVFDNSYPLVQRFNAFGLKFGLKVHL